MYVSCSCLVCAQHEYPTIQDAISKIADLGFAALDLDAFENWQHVNPSTLVGSDGSWEQHFVEAVAASGMTVSSLNCGPSTKIVDPNPDAFTRYKREYTALLDLAQRMACPNITLQPGGKPEGVPLGESLDTLIGHARQLSALNEGRDVTLSIEGHQASVIEKPRDALRMVNELWPAVGFTYDPSHFVMQEIALPDTEPLLDCTLHVHARNASSAKMQDTMADGTVDFAWLVSALRRHGFDGALTIEYFAGFDPDFTSTLALRDHLIELGVAAKPH
jgi:sugar phosphate isomerase/epimerase